MRCGTARTVVLALRLGHSLEAAVDLAVTELRELRDGFIGGVVIHAIDAAERHRVVALNCDGPIHYWYWLDGMAAPEKRVAEAV